MFKRKFCLYSVPAAVRRAHVSMHEKVRQVRRISCTICFVGIGCCGRSGRCRGAVLLLPSRDFSCCAYVKTPRGDSEWTVTLPSVCHAECEVRLDIYYFPVLDSISEYIWKSFSQSVSYDAGYKSQFGEHSGTMYLKLSAAGREARRAVWREDFSNMIWRRA